MTFGTTCWSVTSTSLQISISLVAEVFDVVMVSRHWCICHTHKVVGFCMYISNECEY